MLYDKTIKELKQIKNNINSRREQLSKSEEEFKRIKEIYESYKVKENEIISDEERLAEKLYTISSTISWSSTFDKTIIDILVDILFNVEGIHYSYQEFLYGDDIKKRGGILIQDDLIDLYTDPFGGVEISEEEFAKLKSSGKVVVIGDNVNSESVIFYKLNSDANIDCLVDFGQYNYLKYFIDNIVDSRIKLGSLDNSEEFLEDKKKEFISKNFKKVDGEKKLKLVII